MNRFDAAADVFEPILIAIEPVFSKLMGLVPSSERGRTKTKKAVLKFILEEVKRGFHLEHDMIEPFRVEDIEVDVQFQ